MSLHVFRVFIFAVVLVSLAVPRSTPAEDSSGSWRGKWWNYYERAVAKSEGGDWAAARNDLLKAIELRNRDQRRARTYGMHFIDYFPHRELGVAYFNLGDLSKSLAELELSYASEESAKAAFYLNAVRLKLLRQKPLRPQPPRISLASPLSGSSSREASITVSGQVTAESLVAALRINGSPFRFDLARDSMSFSREVPLEDDATRIVVEAIDLLGNSARTEIPVLVDREGPSLSLTAISRSAIDKNKISLRARLCDASGISGLTVNGIAVPTNNARELELDTVTVMSAATGMVHIEAVDTLGNRTTADLEPDRERSALLTTVPRVLVAMNGPGFFSADKEAPVITLKESDDLPAVYIDRYYVEGEAFDNARLERITINGREIQIAKGKKLFFSKMMKLKEGSNRIVVEATDSAGNKKTAEFGIRRIVPSSRQNSARMSLSVLPFAGTVKNATVQEMADDFLVAALVEQKRFQVIEREKLKQILQEQKLAKEKLTDPAHSIQVGKLLSADALLATTITEGQKSVEIITRLINTETAEVMETKDAYSEDKSLAAVKELMEGLASKLTLGFPLVEGVVVKRDKMTLFSDLGSATGVRKSMAVAVYRRGKEVKHPLSGKSLGWDMIKLGDGAFEEVQDGFSKVRLHDKPKPPQDIQAKDIIITR